MRGPPLSTRGMSGTVSVPDTTRLYPVASHADMSSRYREFCRDTPWQGPCDLCRTRSPRDLALGLPVVYEHCTYISRLARCALSKIGLAGDVEGSYGLLLPLLICLYVLTYFRPMPRLFCILHTRTPDPELSLGSVQRCVPGRKKARCRRDRGA